MEQINKLVDLQGMDMRVADVIFFIKQYQNRDLYKKSKIEDEFSRVTGNMPRHAQTRYAQITSYDKIIAWALEYDAMRDEELAKETVVIINPQSIDQSTVNSEAKMGYETRIGIGRLVQEHTKPKTKKRVRLFRAQVVVPIPNLEDWRDLANAHANSMPRADVMPRVIIQTIRNENIQVDEILSQYIAALRESGWHLVPQATKIKGVLVIAMNGDQCVGHAQLFSFSEGEGDLTSVAILPIARGIGICPRLVGAVAQWANKTGIVSVTTSNLGGQPWYRCYKSAFAKNGWTTTARGDYKMEFNKLVSTQVQSSTQAPPTSALDTQRSGVAQSGGTRYYVKTGLKKNGHIVFCKGKNRYVRRRTVDGTLQFMRIDVVS